MGQIGTNQAQSSTSVGISLNINPSEQPDTDLSYLVRIIPLKKSDAQTFEWHGVHERLTSPVMLKVKLMKDKLPSTLDLFQIGYIGKRSVRRGIENNLDLSSMYKQLLTGL